MNTAPTFLSGGKFYIQERSDDRCSLQTKLRCELEYSGRKTKRRLCVFKEESQIILESW